MRRRRTGTQRRTSPRRRRSRRRRHPRRPRLSSGIPVIPLFRVHMPPASELMPALEQTLYSGYIGQGPRAAEFERQLSGFLGYPDVLAVNSCTSAIQLALRLADVESGEVITTPMTCAATALPV